MVDFQLDEMQEMLRDLAHEFAVDEVRPHAEHWDADEVYPIDAIRAAHEMGLLNLHIPEAYGGPGLGCMEEVLVNEELAWGDPWLRHRSLRHRACDRTHHHRCHRSPEAGVAAQNRRGRGTRVLCGHGAWSRFRRGRHHHDGTPRR